MDVAGVIGMRLDGDAEPCAEEGGSDLGAGFLEAVGMIAEALAELPVQAMRGAGPMRRLVPEHAIPGLGACAPIGVEDAGLVRHVDGVGGAPVAGLGAADDDLGAGRREIRLGRSDARDWIGRQHCGGLVALHLLGANTQ